MMWTMTRIRRVMTLGVRGTMPKWLQSIKSQQSQPSPYRCQPSSCDDIPAFRIQLFPSQQINEQLTQLREMGKRTSTTGMEMEMSWMTASYLHIHANTKRLLLLRLLFPFLANQLLGFNYGYKKVVDFKRRQMEVGKVGVAGSPELETKMSTSAVSECNGAQDGERIRRI
uniref:HDC07405 n=1 Tax=Drosophila melanogaster TaxID=7227 RepID=Q6IG27_DROME|nr:TPA_inf: HDC07405 [Drosophila melanogaster]